MRLASLVNLMKPELTVLTSMDAPKPVSDEAASPAQGEMPFAVADGEPVTQLPQDLYIPPYALQVFLEAFEGPLDLLLYLIRRQNLNILDIPIAEITRQYVQYIEVMKELQLELAGEYLLMAAMLAEIKSRMLLPRQDPDADEIEEDPRAALIQQLQRYEQFTRAAKEIDELPRLERDLHLTEPYFVQEYYEEILPQATLNELATAFRRVMNRAQQNQHLQIGAQTLNMREKMVHILDILQSGQHLRFEALFNETEGREGVVVSFIAILELMRDGLIIIIQQEAFSPIHVKVAA